jgi:hypothetical protein
MSKPIYSERLQMLLDYCDRYRAYKEAQLQADQTPAELKRRS